MFYANECRALGVASCDHMQAAKCRFQATVPFCKLCNFVCRFDLFLEIAIRSSSSCTCDRDRYTASLIIINLFHFTVIAPMQQLKT